MSTKAAKPLQFSAVLRSLLALSWHSKQGQGRKCCVCGCALVAREKSVTGASSVLFIPHVTLSPALQRRSELGRQQAGEAAAGWWRRTFLCLGGTLHTACSLWLCSLWGPWRFACYLVWEPSVSEIENTFVLLNPAWGRADWKAQDPELVSAQFTWGFAGTHSLQRWMSFLPFRASAGVCRPPKLMALVYCRQDHMSEFFSLSTQTCYSLKHHPLLYPPRKQSLPIVPYWKTKWQAPSLQLDLLKPRHWRNRGGCSHSSSTAPQYIGGLVRKDTGMEIN